MTDTRQLIALLTRNVRPVRPLAPPRVRFGGWAALVLAIVVPCGITGVKHGLLDRLTEPVVAAGLFLTAVTSVLAALAALHSAVPGAPLRPVMRATLAGSILWGAVYAIAGSVEPFTGLGTVRHCIQTALLLGSAPLVLLGLMLRRGFVLDRRRAAALAVLASLAAGAFGLGLLCPDPHGVHLLVSHWLPAIALAALAAIVMNRR